MGGVFNKTFVWCTLGIVLNFLFRNMVGSHSAFVAIGDTNSTFARIAFFASSLVSFICIFLFCRKLSAHASLVSIASALVGAAGVALIILAPYQYLVSAPHLAVLGCIAVGLSWAGGFLSPFKTIGFSFTDTQISLLSVLYLTSSLLGTIMIPFASNEVVLTIATLLPIAVCLCSLQAKKAAGGPITRHVLPIQKTKRLWITQIALLAFSFVAISAYTKTGLWGNVRYGTDYLLPWSLFLSVVLSAIIAPIAFKIFNWSLKKSLSSIYYFSQGAVAITFVLVIFFTPLFPSDLAEKTSMPLIFAGTTICGVSFVFATLSSVRIFDTPLVRIGGASFAFLQLFSLIRIAFPEGSTIISGIFVLCGSLASIALLLLLNFDRVSKPHNQQNRYLELAQEHGLTEREAEILKLLAEGRSAPRIQEELYLAEGTVRNYITRIYRKFGVANRQELLDLLK